MDTSGVAGMETDEAGANQVTVLPDVEAGDEVVIADVTFGWGVPAFGDLPQVFFEVSDDVLESGNLRGVLRGAGLYGEGEAVDKLLKVLGRDVGMSVEGGKHRPGGQRRGVSDRSSSGRRGERDGGDGG